MRMINPSWIIPAARVGKDMTLKYPTKFIPADVARYMFVGLPIINIIDQVFAAANSPTKYGIGLIFVFLQKKQINGVRVKTTISLDVKTVKSAVSK